MQKIYVVKRGRETDIFDDWKRQCEPQIDRFSGALFCGIEYRTEFEDADATKKGSLRHAFALAEQYVNDPQIGGFRLVYQGENKDYAQEESWKLEGYLPFGKASADADGGDENDGAKPVAGFDLSFLDEDIKDAIPLSADDAKKTDGEVIIEEVTDEIREEVERLCREGTDEEEEEADEEKQEAILREAMRDDIYHIVAEEIYGKLHIPARPNPNEPWVEILLDITGCRGAYSSGYMGRYHVPVLYTVLLAFVFRPSAVLNKFVETYKSEILPKIKVAERPSITPTEWVQEARGIWEDSDECQELRGHFAINGMDELDFDELRQRCINFLATSDGTQESGFTTYKRMKEYVKKGGRSLIDLYQEMTENAVYRTELVKMSGPYVNPDLEQELPFKETKMSFKQLAMQAESIGIKLKERVIGQDDAINKLESAFFHAEKSARQDEKRRGPRSVFLFAGPAGVGKTFTAQLFADELGLPFRRFDMSGYPQSDSVDELVGISTFWKGSKAGVLTSYVKENPRCVLLFDEIEKAHSAVIRLFLQILDEGVCFDHHEDTDISFADTLIIFTTNAGKQLYRDAQGENLTALPDKVVLDALAKDINPEIGGRFSRRRSCRGCPRIPSSCSTICGRRLCGVWWNGMWKSSCFKPSRNLATA